MEKYHELKEPNMEGEVQSGHKGIQGCTPRLTRVALAVSNSNNSSFTKTIAIVKIHRTALKSPRFMQYL